MREGFFFCCDRLNSHSKEEATEEVPVNMHILTTTVILIVSKQKLISDERIAKIHSVIINFAVYLICLLNRKVCLRMLRPEDGL